MRVVPNIIWLVLCGVWMAIAYAVAGLICFALFFLIITIPFGIAAFRIAAAGPGQLQDHPDLALPARGAHRAQRRQVRNLAAPGGRLRAGPWWRRA
jgi:Inner membrane component domain